MVESINHSIDLSPSSATWASSCVTMGRALTFEAEKGREEYSIINPKDEREEVDT